jgi:hypothetical protein
VYPLGRRWHQSSTLRYQPVLAHIRLFRADTSHYRIIGNYTLEISPEEKQPQYLGVVSLLESCPLLVSPLVGLLISKVSFEPVFLGGSALIIWPLDVQAG